VFAIQAARILADLYRYTRYGDSVDSINSSKDAINLLAFEYYFSSLFPFNKISIVCISIEAIGSTIATVSFFMNIVISYIIKHLIFNTTVKFPAER